MLPERKPDLLRPGRLCSATVVVCAQNARRMVDLMAVEPGCRPGWSGFVKARLGEVGLARMALFIEANVRGCSEAAMPSPFSHHPQKPAASAH
jgi:hypothetical protein